MFTFRLLPLVQRISTDIPLFDQSMPHEGGAPIQASLHVHAMQRDRTQGSLLIQSDTTVNFPYLGTKSMRFSVSQPFPISFRNPNSEPLPSFSLLKNRRTHKKHDSQRRVVERCTQTQPSSPTLLSITPRFQRFQLPLSPIMSPPSPPSWLLPVVTQTSPFPTGGPTAHKK